MNNSVTTITHSCSIRTLYINFKTMLNYAREKFCYKIFFQIKTNISDISQYKFYQPKKMSKTVENIEYKLHKTPLLSLAPYRINSRVYKGLGTRCSIASEIAYTDFIVSRTTKQTMAWVQVSTYLQPVHRQTRKKTSPESRHFCGLCTSII